MYTTPFYGIPDPNAFCKWISAFSNKMAYVRPIGTEKSDCVKYLVNKTLADLASIKIKNKNVKILELNVLRACYLASQAVMPEMDWRADERRELKLFMDSLPIALENIKSLMNYISTNRSFSAKAFAQTDNPIPKATINESALSHQRLRNLERLLEDYEYGLIDFNMNHDHIALISSSDFIYGPFDFNYDLNSEWKSKGAKSSDLGKNIIEVGLMFNLAYLFRYFTMDAPPIISDSIFFDEEEILRTDSVRMLTGGKPHLHFVANLSNAVFGTKYSSRDVKDKLDSLLKSNSKSPSKAKRMPPDFIGWC